MQFFRGVEESSIPEVQLLRSRTGTSGSARIVFDNPSLFQASSEMGEITGLFMVDDEVRGVQAGLEGHAAGRRARSRVLCRAGAGACQCAAGLLMPARAHTLPQGELSTTDVKAKFVNGKPAAVEARLNLRTQFEWERFMRFMDRSVQALGARATGRQPLGGSRWAAAARTARAALCNTPVLMLHTAPTHTREQVRRVQRPWLRGGVQVRSSRGI